jgi:hypothetical protein
LMRRFLLYDGREHPSTPNFATTVAEGVLFNETQDVVLQWFGKNSSTVHFATTPEITGLQKFEAVSVKGHDHEGRMMRWVKWLDT